MTDDTSVITPLDLAPTLAPRFASSVAEEIRSILESYGEYFDSDDEKRLKEIANTLTSSSIEPTHKRGTHRLSGAKYTNQSPIYASMDPHPAFGGASEEYTHSLERVVRLALLLHFLNKLKVSSIPNARMFCHNFRRKIDGTNDPVSTRSTIYRTVNQKFISAIQTRNWTQLTNLIADLKRGAERQRDDDYTSYITQYFEPIAQTLAQYCVPEKKSLPLPRVKQSLNPTPSIPGGIVPNANIWTPSVRHLSGDDPAIEGGTPPPPGQIVIHNNEEDRGEASENTLKKLSIRGSHLWMAGILGLKSQDALVKEEAQACMDFLLRYKATSSATEIARHLWILQGLCGHRYDNLLQALGVKGLDNIARPELKLVYLDNSQLDIRFTLPRADKFAQPAAEIKHYFNTSSSEVSLKVNLAHPTLTPQCLKLLSGITAGINDPFLQDVLAAKLKIQADVRHSITDRFNESRWRGSFIQACYGKSWDLCLLQLIFAEPLGISDAPMYYLGVSDAQVLSVLDSARQYLFGSRFTAVERALPDRHVGPPNSTFNISNIFKAVAAIETACSNAEKSFEHQTIFESLIKEHNLRTFRLGLLLTITTASRNNADFHAFTLDQIGLSSHVILIEDKQSDPSILRRIAALPKYAIGEVYRYLAHLAKLADRLRRHSSNVKLQELTVQINNSLVSKAPLLFLLREGMASPYSILPCIAKFDHSNATEVDAKELRNNTQGLHIETWNGNTQLKRQFGSNKFTRNISRHLMSTYLRSHSTLSGLLIETQLGHNPGYALFRKESVVSVREFSDAMDGPLTQYLLACGFDVEQCFELPPHMAHITRPTTNWAILDQIVKEKYQNDAKLIKSLKKANITKESKQHLNTIINEAIRSRINIEQGAPWPPNIKITENESLDIYRNVIGQLTNSPEQLSSATKKLRKRLIIFKRRKGWSIEFPPIAFWDITLPIPLTTSHLNAYDAMQHLRRCVDQVISKKKTNLSGGEYALVILVSGGASTFKAAYELLSYAESTIIDRKYNYATVSIRQPTIESRTVSGIAMHAVLGWQRQNRKLPRYETALKQAAELLPCEWRHNGTPDTINAINELVSLSRKVEIPPCLAEVESSNIPCRALPQDRLMHLLHQTGNNQIWTPSTSDEASTREVSKTPNPDESLLTKQFAELKRVIRDSKNNKGSTFDGQITESKRPTRAARKAVKQFRQDNELTQLIELLTHWADQLLSDSANFKSGDRLVTETILEYLNDAGKILIRAMAGLNIYELDEDEWHSLIQQELSEEEGPRDRQASQLNRFFRECAPEFDLPSIFFSTHSSRLPAELSIDAGIITDAEMKWTHSQLDTWSRHKDLTTAERLALESLHEHTYFQSSLGARISEIQHLACKDVQHYPDATVIHIRHNPRRGVKTKASTRSNTVAAWRKPQTIAEGNYYFNPMNTPGLSFKPTSLLQNILRIASGDPTSRSHRFRHTKATTEGIVIFNESDITLRIHLASRLFASLGHSSYLVTLQYYTHSAHHVIGTRYSLPSTAMRNETNARLLGMTGHQYNQRVWRHHARNAKKAGLLPDFNNQTYISTTYEKPVLTELPAALKKTPPTPAEMLTFLAELYAGKDTNQVASGRLSPTYREILAIRLLQVQRRINWEVVPESILNTFLTTHEYDFLDINLNSKRKRRNISQPLFKHWIRLLKKHDVTTDHFMSTGQNLSSAMQGVSWRSQQVIWRLASKNDASNVLHELQALHVPLFIKESSTFENHIEPTLPTPKLKSAHTVRAVLLTILVLTEGLR